MQALHDAYKDKGFLVLGLSIDRTGIDVVQDYVDEHKLTFPNVHDPTATSAIAYGVRGVPTTYFIDADGKALGMIVGPRPWDSQEVHDFVEQLLAETNNLR